MHAGIWWKSPYEIITDRNDGRKYGDSGSQTRGSRFFRLRPATTNMRAP